MRCFSCFLLQHSPVKNRRRKTLNILPFTTTLWFTLVLSPKSPNFLENIPKVFWWLSWRNWSNQWCHIHKAGIDISKLVSRFSTHLHCNQDLPMICMHFTLHYFTILMTLLPVKKLLNSMWPVHLFSKGYKYHNKQSFNVINPDWTRGYQTDPVEVCSFAKVVWFSHPDSLEDFHNMRR